MWNLLTTLTLVVSAASPAPPGPTFAREDTMTTEVPEVLVTAPRVTLDEILDRVARGESHRESLMVDQSFTATFRFLTRKKDGKETLLKEKVMRVYKKRPDRVRSLTLRETSEKTKKRGDMDVSFRSTMGEEIVNFAFRPENRREFNFRIEGREIIGNQLIYRIAFEPRTTIDPSMPTGVCWVNTNEFVIIRQELGFERSPAALFIKDVERMVIERRNVDGHWVLWRVLCRMKWAIPIPTMGSGIDMSILLDSYAINTGLTDAFFDEAPKGDNVEEE